MKTSILMSAKIQTAKHVEWFHQAVNSILANTYGNYQFVIVNDNSEIWEPPKEDHRIKVIHNTDSKGLAHALNIGLFHCTGDIIIHMDADDIARTTMISKLVGFFHDTPQAVCCGIQLEAFHHNNGSPMTLGGGFPTRHPKVIDLEIWKRRANVRDFWFINHPGATFKKDVVMKLGGYREGVSAKGVISGGMEDMILFNEMAMQGYVINNLQEVLMDYRWKPAPGRQTRHYFEAYRNETDKFREAAIG